MRIAVVGGGPAGLYFARLLKRHSPGHDVTVFEQNAPGATFGFGVGLGGKARERIRSMDPEVHDHITKSMVFGNEQRIHINGADILLEYAQIGGAIGRLDLLQILQGACSAVGVDLRHDIRIESLDQLSGYDLVVGADGANSVIRRLHGDGFGTSVHHLTNRFAWYGVERAMTPGSLIFRETPLGRFVGHCYPYTPSMSTFVAECDAITWEQAGFAGMSDDQRRAIMEAVFAPELDGDSLMDNRSVWRRFPVITNAHWSAGNAVLLGDALLTAHYSIGSGTRLAMDDAAALFEAIDQTESVPLALGTFEELRRPMRERFRVAAEKSFTWYENLAQVVQQEPLDFVYSFLTRTGRVDAERLPEYCPGFYELYTRSRSPEGLAAH